MNKFQVSQKKKKEPPPKNGIPPSNDTSSPPGKEVGFYFALNHEIRRKILQYLGEHKIASFTELKRLTGESTGTIYHHLDDMKNLIYQDKN